MPGECLWFLSNGRAVTSEDMNRDRSQWKQDHWDAVGARAVDKSSFVVYDRASAKACLSNKHVYMIGESTTRDLFYEFSSFAGLKPNRSPCMNLKKGPLCKKQVDSDTGNTRVSYQFISSANNSKEVELSRSLTSPRAPDAVFLYCMMYDWMGPMMQQDSPAMGEACMKMIDEAVRSPFPNVPIYLLGPIFPPNWVSPYPNRTRDDSVMARIFRSINSAAGISCVRHGQDNYRVVSSRGIRGPIDRYNSVGHRKHDMIHPMPNAHVPDIQVLGKRESPQHYFTRPLTQSRPCPTCADDAEPHVPWRGW